MLKLWVTLSCCLLVRTPIVASASLNERNDSTSGINYLVNGEEISVVNAPYQAVLFLNNQFHCGGNIIAPIWILTAGHCVVTSEQIVYPANTLFVRVGTDDALQPGEADRPVDAVFLHPNFSLFELNFDVSLLRLIPPLVFSERVRCIPMAPPGTPAVAGELLFITGYGKRSEDDTSPPANTHLQSIQVPIMDKDECQNQYAFQLVITDQMFCVTAPWKSSCHYDSGGPAVLQGQLLGLVTGARHCGDPMSPGYYALIPSMRDWIDETVFVNSQHNPPDGQCN